MNKTFGLYLVGWVVVFVAALIPSLAWLSPVSFVLLMPLAAIWIWRSERRPLRDLGYGLSTGWFRYLLLGLVCGISIPIVLKTVSSLAGWVSLSPRGLPLTDLLVYFPQVLLKMIPLVAIEELLSRGFFFRALQQRLDIRLAAVLSSLLWGAGHLAAMVSDGLTPGQISIGLLTFLLWGLALCLCSLRSGNSLWLPYGLHLGVNLSFSLLGALFVTQSYAPEWWLGHPAWSPESGLIGVLGWLIIANCIYVLTGNKKPETDEAGWRVR